MYIKVRVTPDAQKEVVTKTRSDVYEISVREPRERNLANRRICDILSSIYKIDIKKVRIISGHRSVSKIISLER